MSPSRASRGRMPPRPRRASLRPKDRLIVALDTSDPAELRSLLKGLRGRVGCFKVGLQLFSARGPSVVRQIVKAGERVFLDLKFHDIPNTAAGAVAEAVRLGAAFIDLHVSGGEAMLKAAVKAARKARETGPRPRLLGVTILTSMDPDTLATLGLRGSVRGLAVKLARLAQGAGLDGVVASRHEVEAIKKACGPSFLVVVPGIRPAGSAKGDQKRTATPAQALTAGADYIVVGRPITRAADPAAAADAILAEMEA